MKKKELIKEIKKLREELEKNKIETEKKIMEEKKYVCINIIKNILPIVDSLEITHINCKEKQTKEGLEITLRMLNGSLLMNNVKVINPKKYERFNPFYHQALLKAKEKGKEPNLISAVLQKGYHMYKKILRPALVSVTK